MATVRAGKGDRQAVFSAEIPANGDWELQLHLPNKLRFRSAKRWGVWKLVVDDATGPRDLTFDADRADMGWNTVGTLRLMSGEVELLLSDDTDGQIVVADAIRWLPAAAGGAGEAGRIE